MNSELEPVSFFQRSNSAFRRVVIGTVLSPAGVFDAITLIIPRSKSTSLHFRGNASAFGLSPVSSSNTSSGEDNLSPLPVAVAPPLS